MVRREIAKQDEYENKKEKKLRKIRADY